MKRNDIRKAYDATLPDEITRQRVLQGILSVASAQPPERETMKRKTIKRATLIALAAALVLGVTALAAERYTARIVMTKVRGSGVEETVLGEIAPKAFDDEAYAAYAASRAGKGESVPSNYPFGGGEWVFFPDETTFTEKTCVEIPHTDDLTLRLFNVKRDDLTNSVNFTATASLDGKSCLLHGNFAVENALNEKYLGTDWSQQYELYGSVEYAPGHSAEILEYVNEENDIHLYWFIFCENDVYYNIQLSNGTQNYDPDLTPKTADMDFYQAIMAALAVR